MSEDWNKIGKHVLEEEKLASSEEEMPNINIKEAKETVRKIDTYFKLKKIDTDSAWNNLSLQLNDKKAIPLRIQLMRIAAVLLLLIAVGFITWNISDINNQISVKTAHKNIAYKEVILPDGTIVTLSRNSKLKYPKEFGKENRIVKLKGEAFFNVTPNAQKPFIIKTAKATVRVLGTSFNVCAYNKDEFVEVFVKTGKVEFSGSEIKNNSSQKIILLPGEKGTLCKSTNSLSKTETENNNSLAWMTHEIEFSYTHLDDVVSTLEHTYGVNIELNPTVDKSLPINATFNKQNLDYIIEIIAQTHNLKVEKENAEKYILTK